LVTAGRLKAQDQGKGKFNYEAVYSSNLCFRHDQPTITRENEWLLFAYH
jgi:hypothetical protein